MMKKFKDALVSADLMSKINSDIFHDPNSTYGIIENEMAKAKELHMPSKTVRFNKYKH